MAHLQSVLAITAYKNFGTNLSQVNEPGEDIVYLFNSGNPDAFTSVYNILYPSIFYFARRFVNADDAADITADAFYKLWKMDKSFERLQSIKVFLQVSVRNACLNYLRNEKSKERKQSELLYLSDQTAENASLNYDEVEADFFIRIEAEIENLPNQCRKVFKMAYFEGLKNKQIAEYLKISENTVTNHKYKALKLLRLALQDVNPLLIAMILFQLYE